MQELASATAGNRVRSVCVLLMCCSLCAILSCQGGSVSNQAEQAAGSADPKIGVESERLGELFHKGRGALHRLTLRGSDPKRAVRGVEFSLYVTRDGRSMRVVNGALRRGNSDPFSASLYCLSLKTPLGDAQPEAARFAVTANIPGEAGLGEQKVDFSIDLKDYEIEGPEIYLFPWLEPSQEAVLLNYFCRSRRLTEGAKEYLRKHTRVEPLPLPPLPTETKEDGNARNVRVPITAFGLHDLVSVREHTVESGDVVVSIAVKLLEWQN